MRKSADGVITHAWVERDTDHMVIDRANGRAVEMHVNDYYSRLDVAYAVRYSYADAVRLSICHQGPWDPELDAVVQRERELKEKS